jgi:hypothetical protein
MSHELGSTYQSPRTSPQQNHQQTFGRVCLVSSFVEPTGAARPVLGPNGAAGFFGDSDRCVDERHNARERDPSLSPQSEDWLLGISLPRRYERWFSEGRDRCPKEIRLWPEVRARAPVHSLW